VTRVSDPCRASAAPPPVRPTVRPAMYWEPNRRTLVYSTRGQTGRFRFIASRAERGRFARNSVWAFILSADALPATLYGHFTQATYRNWPITLDDVASNICRAQPDHTAIQRSNPCGRSGHRGWSWSDAPPSHRATPATVDASTSRPAADPPPPPPPRGLRSFTYQLNLSRF
jgi:hypothetical protein